MSQPPEKPVAEPAAAAAAAGETAEAGGQTKSAAKKAAAKAAKEAKKEAAAKQRAEQDAARAGAAAAATTELDDKNKGNWGVLPLIQSAGAAAAASSSTASTASTAAVARVRVSELDEKTAERVVRVRARVHTSRQQGKALAFVTLREGGGYSVQAVLEAAVLGPAMVSWAASLHRETLVELEATVALVPKPIESATQRNVELKTRRLFVVSAVVQPAPLTIEDCARPQPVLDAQNAALAALTERIAAEQTALAAAEAAAAPAEKLEEHRVRIRALEKEKSEAARYADPDQSTRLDYRFIDLRTPANQAIFRVQAGVCQLFREFLIERRFMEIHTPKIIGAASEGGANVFKMGYFDGAAYLAQSPQFYKQMCVTSDFERVFEIGPVFRAENALTHRHLTEFNGLDLEMTFDEHYHEVLTVIEDLFFFIFDGINTRFARELSLIRAQFPFEDLVFKKPCLRLTYPEAVAMLQEAGTDQPPLEDLSTANERQLGALVKAKYGTDFYVLDKFPSSARPFYTMPAAHDPNYANAYDFFVRGEEICSGSQRVHDAVLLEKRIAEKGIKMDPSIQAYVDSFKFGAPPHGGCGIGLERIVMLFLGLKNIRRTSMFPRDPKRVTP